MRRFVPSPTPTHHPDTFSGSPVDSAPLEREAPFRPAPPGTVAKGPPPSTAVPRAVPLDHRLPVHRNKVGRITEHAAELSADLREWVELRVQLLKKEVEERIEGRLSAVKGLAIVGVVAAIAGLFALVTLAIGLGAAFGGRYWLGFLIVTLLLAAVAFVAKVKLAPGPIRVEQEKTTGKIKISHEETPAEHEAKTNADTPPTLTS